MCAPCHSRRVNLGGEYALTGNLFDNFLPEVLRTEYYHPDGQVNDENYVYGSFVQSKMFHNYVKCTSCHDPHSMKLKLEGNLLCQQCHDVSYNDPAHHFHEQNTLSSECVSCHMPSKVYMGNDLRHDHSFRVPRPDQSEKYGTPNTCNGCHSEKSNKWAADAIEKWYGSERAYHFSDDLIEGSLMNENSYDYLISLLQKDSIPNIAKATAIHYLSIIDPGNALPYFLINLKSKSPLLRVHALKALDGIPFSNWKSYAEPLLKDSIKAVRISAYELFINVPEDQIGRSVISDLKTSKLEYETYLDHQLDFPLGKAGKGLYKQKLGFYDESKQYYEAAINQDSLQTGIRTNLSLVYNALGENIKAKKVLLDEVTLNPNNVNALYNLALLYYELDEIDNSKKYFEMCMEHRPENSRIYYNYGLLLQQIGADDEALNVYNKGLAINPHDNDLNYIIAIYYLNNQNSKKARKYLEALVANNPGNQQYLQMLQSISQVN
jgi:predicted CXXCH cytochrome family protein